ncbi:MAG: hypothetical protein H0U91_14900 [Rubrobacter sp.]|nr:hypothetical protein [Rubrobacter sp.]MDQ3360355.1 hypothetical protein [Actinomycetota bacterium]MDQ3375966.1 hypothetical protein [Actinomycetota bacterium]
MLSFLPGVLLVGFYLLALFLVSLQPPGADEVAYAFGMAVLVVLTVLSELVALGFGVAGALQRRRKRTFALLGVTCSVIVLAAIHAQVGLADLASGAIAFFTEPPPKVDIVSPGKE